MIVFIIVNIPRDMKMTVFAIVNILQQNSTLLLIDRNVCCNNVSNETEKRLTFFTLLE